MKTQITPQIIGLEEDLQREIRNINEKSVYALTVTGVEMVRDLQGVLHREWYQKYTPSMYERRTDNPSLGTPLGDDSNFQDTSTDVATKTLEFVYNPTGEHENPDWNNRSGNNLITWIQKKHEYKKPGSNEPYLIIPARPFWNKFVDEQIDGGIMEKFIRAMSPEYKVVKDSSDKLDSLAAESYLPQDFE